jgi:hypothetical protein
MTEPKIRDYFDGIIPLEEVFLINNEKSHKITAYYKQVEAIEEGSYLITSSHLIKLCDDIIAGLVLPEALETIAFILIGSDYFYWDVDTDEGDRTAQVIIEWGAPLSNFPLTLFNIEQWKKYLSGQDRLMKFENGSSPDNLYT